jgi:predicted dehydrogenase
MAKFTRRQFLEDSLLVAAAMAVLPSGKLLGAEEKQSISPNEKLGVAIIGVNGQGKTHLKIYANRKDTEVAYIVDVDEAVGQKQVEEAAKIQGRKHKFVQDLRKVFDDKSVDIVSIATPNHWHALAAIWAIQAGKHVYLEKPVSYTLSEGRRIVEAARKHNKICQAGMQFRTITTTVDAVEYVRSGKIGEVKLARGLCYKLRRSIGPRGEYKVPTTVDYDLWSGPAPVLPLTREKFHYDWHWQWPYGGGDLCNQGAHEMDLARWGLGLTGLSKRVFSYGGRLGYEDAGETPNTLVVVHEFPDDGKTLAFEVRGLKTDKLKDADVGVIFYGSDGYVVTMEYKTGGPVAVALDRGGNVVKKFSGGNRAEHFANFIKAVRSGNKEDLHADILEGHLSSALCHMGNISYRLGQETSVADLKKRLSDVKSNENALETFDRVTAHLTDNGIKIDQTKLRVGPELVFDPASETFPGSDAANKFLARQYRTPFVVPAAGEV